MRHWTVQVYLPNLNLSNSLNRVHECDKRQTNRPRYRGMCSYRRIPHNPWTLDSPIALPDKAWITSVYRMSRIRIPSHDRVYIDAGETRLAVRGDGVGSNVPVDVHCSLPGRHVRHHHTGSYALRHARSPRDWPLRYRPSNATPPWDNAVNLLLLTLPSSLLLQWRVT